MEIEPRGTCVLEDDFAATPPGTARQDIPAVGPKSVPLRLDADSDRSVGGLALLELAARPFRDQLGHPRKRAFEVETLARRVEVAVHQRLPAWRRASS
jgi:hypothetical protein